MQYRNKQKDQRFLFGLFVMALGFEPRTACLEGRCSIQLSYATIKDQFTSFVDPVLFCRGGRIRTCDLRVPNAAR